MPIIKLKPCPFCGRKAEIKFLHYSYDADGEHFKYYVCCSASNIRKCAVRPCTALYKDKKKAIKTWNRRTDNEK